MITKPDDGCCCTIAKIEIKMMSSREFMIIKQVVLALNGFFIIMSAANNYVSNWLQNWLTTFPLLCPQIIIVIIWGTEGDGNCVVYFLRFKFIKSKKLQEYDQ